MQAMRLSIPDVILFTPRVFGDARGFFFESFNQSTFEALSGLSRAFVQDNHSKSQAGVLRGLHYQLSPKAGGYSPTFGNIWSVGRGEIVFGKQSSALDSGRLCAWFSYFVRNRRVPL
jgi:dTDP-4-dehydrorhamnose 3,5-epimerase